MLQRSIPADTSAVRSLRHSISWPSMTAARQQSSTTHDQTLELPSGRLRVRIHGTGGPLAIGVPGLSANALSFEAVGAHLAVRGRSLAAVDLRGRGRSPAGPPGSHGWENHARDVLAIADRL